MSGRRVARHRLGGSFLLGRLAGAKTVEFDERCPRHRLDEEVRQCPNQRVDAIRRKPRSLAIKVRRERAHLIFHRRERADVKHPTRLLFVECGDGFRSDD